MKTLVFINEEQYQDDDLAELFSDMSEQNIKFEILDLSKKENQDTYDLYGIMQTPAIIVTQDDGKLISIWQKDIPRVDQISTAVGSV